MKTVIGLEIHVQLKTLSKMFCGCDNNAEGKEPNEVTCPVCLGMPGTLPVANKQAIDWTIMTGLSFHSKINPKSKFDRKHYFYPDLPKGYQISQYDEPFCRGGYIEIDGKKIRLRRVHLEEDAGKLVHPKGANYSLVDLNRAGTPLMEIVTEPDINSPVEAKAFLQKLRTILRHLGVSDADMEKGHLRCDANISIEVNGKEGVPAEIKNMNSFKMVERALTYEEERQKGIISEGEKVEKETRGWIDAKGITVSQRGKEYAEDYRYFPEPDLPPFVSDKEYVEGLKKDIGEDLDTAGDRYKEIGVAESELRVITANPAKKNYFDQVIEFLGSEKEKILASKWLVNRFFNKNYPPEQYAIFIKKVSAGEIPSARAVETIKEAAKSNKGIDEVIKDKGLTKIDDSDKINTIVSEVISKNEKPVADYGAGKEQALKFLVGQIMAKSKGQVDPQKAEKILKEKLGGANGK